MFKKRTWDESLNGVSSGFDYLQPVWWSDQAGNHQVGLYCGMSGSPKDPYLVYYCGCSDIKHVSELHPIGVPPGYTVGEFVQAKTKNGLLAPSPLIGIVGDKYIVVNLATIGKYHAGERYSMNRWDEIERVSKPAEKSNKEVGMMISRWWNDQVRSGLNPAFVTCELDDSEIGFAVPMSSHDYSDFRWCGSYTDRDGDTWFSTKELLAQLDAVVDICRCIHTHHPDENVGGLMVTTSCGHKLLEPIGPAVTCNGCGKRVINDYEGVFHG